MSRTFRVTLVLVLLCIIGSAAFVSYKVFFSNPARTIPLLKGSSIVEAVQSLERMGIKARIEEEESALPRGIVIGQWPETGMKLRADKVAILKVSRGSQKLPLPDLRGLTQQQAIDRLQESGFVVGEIQKIHHERPAGVVIAQNPASPVSISPGRSVGLLVSLGPTVASGSVVVPDLLERDVETATQLARESSLKPSVEYVYDLSSPQGMVISMRPSAGRQVSRGSTVTLRVASWDTSRAPQQKAHSEPKTAAGAKVAVVTPESDKSHSSQMQEQVTASTSQNAAPTVAETPKPAPKPAASQKKKTAAIRYQAPPVSGQSLKIEMIDKSGERTLLDRTVSAGEFIKLDVPYVGEAVVTIYLGGNFVWQDRYK